MYPSAKNVIVLMFDSLQYNYLGCNGNTWVKTPNFDRFARESMVFDNCYIEGLPTVPCRRAMHTGRFTLPVKGWSVLDMDDTTIADLCWGSNIDTALVFDCPMYRLPKFGYTRSFDKVWFIHGHEGDHQFYRKDELIHLNTDDYIDEKSKAQVCKTVGEGKVDAAVEEITDYLKQRQYWKCEEDQNVPRVMKKAVEYLEGVDRNKPFYLWVDNFDPHEPWDTPSVYDPEGKCVYDADYKGKDEFMPFSVAVDGVYTEEQMHHVRMLYAEKVTMCDRWLGWFMTNVKRLGLEENTMVLLVSDHGEPMGNAEHGHGIMRKCRPWPYEELVHGIMMLKAPGVKAGRSKAFVQSCDVAPTVCDFLGLGVRDFHQGKSVLPVAYGEVEKLRDFAVAGYYKYSWSIITDDWSYIHWLNREEALSSSVSYGIYTEGTMEHSSHLGKIKFASAVAPTSETEKKYKEAATLDGEAQWTCTPGSSSEVPSTDELYDRKTDMAQLKNVIGKNPDVAKKLFNELREFMGELRTS